MMSEIEEVEEQIKANMVAMKEKMTTMMEAMMSMRKMMEVNTATVVAASTATKVDPTHPPGFNQVNHPTSDMVQNKHSFPPYGLPPNYTPPNVAHARDGNVDNFAPIPIESQQPQSSHAQVPQPMGETHEVPRDHTLADFEPHLGYATEGHAFCGVPLRNTLRGPQYRPQPQLLHFAFIICMPSSFADLVFAGERIKVGLRRDKFDYAASMNRNPGANGENKKEGETHVVTTIPTWSNFPLALQYQHSANISPSHYPPPYQPRTSNHPQRPPLNQPQNLPVAHPRPNTTINTNQNTNQGRNFPKKKPVEFTPIPMVAIIPTKIPQPPFSRGYNSNGTCAYHGGVLGHSIKHCMTLKHKVQSLIDEGWLKFEEDNYL
ncbi:hypothetical protein GmHk_11G032824 [Glycine max]|nr:hypothetical protein GmHk_11G032824 [Glycine max]